MKEIYLELDDNGEVIELKCHYIKETFRGVTPEGMKKVKGIINWVSAEHGVKAEVRLYDRLFNHPHPDSDKDVEDFIAHLNTDSLITLTDSVVEQSLAESIPGKVYQFEREGYFCADSDLCRDGKLVFNRTVTLRDTWAKMEQS